MSSMTQNQWIEKILWTVSISIIAFGVAEMKEMSALMNQLNIRLAVIVERIERHESEIKSIKEEIKNNESKH